MMFTRKPEERIAELEYQLKLLKWEVEEEKKCYNEETKKNIMEKRVSWVIGNGTIDLTPGKTIKRPLYNLTSKEASELANAVFTHLKNIGIMAEAWSYYDTDRSCYRICAKINET